METKIDYTEGQVRGLRSGRRERWAVIASAIFAAPAGPGPVVLH
jgi:hypothetical protein